MDRRSFLNALLGGAIGAAAAVRRPKPVFKAPQWRVTTKKGLVANDKIYHFADPKFIGKSYVVEHPSMYIQHRKFPC